jgi:hypothetical protein
VERENRQPRTPSSVSWVKRDAFSHGGPVAVGKTITTALIPPRGSRSSTGPVGRALCSPGRE